jgi:hypothetical protein
MTITGDITAQQNLTISGTIYNSNIQFGASDDGFSNTISDAKFDSNAMCIVGKGTAPNRIIHMWDNIFIDRDLRVNGTIYNSNIQVGASDDGISNTISDARLDGNAMCIVGKGKAPNRWIHMWDNVFIERNLRVNGTIYNPNIQVGASDDGISNTISDARFDGNAMCIVGKGNGGNRWIHMWDNVRIDRDIHVNNWTELNTLSVNSDAWLNNVTLYGVLVANAGIKSAWTWNWSDYRVKNNITTVNSVLNRLCEVRVIGFNFTEINTEEKHIGVFAHELQEKFPEITGLVSGKKDNVDENGKIKVQAISNDIVYVLMKAIQEQNQTITDLQTQIQNQNLILKDLQTQINKLNCKY